MFKDTLFDTHFHIFEAAQGIQGARYVPSYGATLLAWQTEAALVGITKGVLVQPSFLGTNNQLLLDTLVQNPTTLRGVAVVSPSVTSTELADMDAMGVRGIRLNLPGQSHDLTEWLRAPHLWEALRRLGWHVEVHTDQGALPQVLAQLPTEIPLVIDHMGKPNTANAYDASFVALRQRSKQSPVYVKLSGAYRLGGINAKAIAQIWLGELGVDRLLWGSDWPCTNHEEQAHYPALLEPLKDWIGVHNQHSVLVTNPHTLYCPEISG